MHFSKALLLLCLGAVSFNIFAQSAGFNSTFAILSINGGANAYYDLNANTANTDFNNANLGTFNPATNSLILRGAEHNVWRCGASDLTSTRLMYRVYSTSGSGGSFTSINVPWTSGFNNGCGGQDQQWSLTGNNLNVLSGLAPGSYFLEVYSEATVTNCCGGMVYAGNGGANYKATFTVSSYVTTNSGSGLAATYSTLAAAITALNAATITSPVIITLFGNETAPAGGYDITKSGTSTNTITIQGSSSTITAPAQTSGQLNNAIFKLTGADWITLQNFTMQERSFTPVAADLAAGTNTMTEWGIALLYASTTNGSQNNTIQGNTITLNRTYQNTFGIYSNSTHSASTVTTSATATSSTGGNSGLKIYGNTISNINLGIVVVGPTAAADANTGIDIGGSSALTGNTITNFGTTGTFSAFANVSGTVNGILVRNSNGFNVSYNSITSSNGGVTVGTLNGIQIQASSNTPTGIFTNTISFNTISLQTGFATGAINGINYPSGSASSTSVLNITNNNFTRMNSSVNTSGAFDAILVASTNLTTNISNNTYTNLTVNTSGNFRFIAHSFSMPASGSTTINNNSIVTGFNKNQAGGTVTITTTNGSSPNSASLTQTNNNFSNITVTGATGITGFNNTDGSGTSCSKTITGNTFNNWTGGSSAISAMIFTYWGGATTNTMSNNTITNITGQGSITGVNIGSTFSSTNTLTFSNNTITDLTSTGTGGTVLAFSCSNTSSTINISGNTVGALSSTAATVTGISVSGSTANNIFNNKVYNLSSSNTSPTVTGITASAGSTNTIYNNLIGNITAPSANSANPIIGLNLSGGTTVNASYNTIYLNNVSSSGGLFGASGIFASTTPTLTLRNNLVRVTGTANGSSNIAAFRRSTSTLTSYSTNSNNNLFFAGTPSATNLIYTENTSAFTNSQQTLASFKTFMSTRDQASQSVDPVFTSTVGSNNGFLHIDPSSNSVGIEGAGVVVSGIATDFDGDTRNATTPDIGADEFIALITCASTPSPTSGTIDVVLSPTLSWAAATNATGYDVYLGTTSGSLTLVSTNQVGLSYSPPTALNPSTQYFWRIVPRNGSNFASGCTEWSFTTQAATPTLSATSLASFANQCINTTSSANSFNLSGVYLTTADITVGPLSGFSFSATSNGTYSSTLTFSQSGGTLASTPVFVQFTPNSVASFNGNIPVSGGGISTAITVAAVGSGVNTAATATTGASSAITGTSATVAGSFVANCQTITAYGIEYSTTNGFVNGSGTQVSSTNQSAGSFTSSLTGLANNTTYYYKAYVTYGATTVYGTQSSFTTPQICSIALQETFPTTTLPTGWTNSSFLFTTATGVPAFTSNYMRVNLYSSVTTANFTTCNYGPVGANATLSFNYSVTNWASSTAPAAGWGNIQVQISTDYGVTYTTINTITNSSASVTPVSISLSSYASQFVKFRFLATWSTGDYNVVIDDINAIAPCVAPNQPTNLTFTNVGPAQMTLNYTASTSSPSGYLIVRYPAGDTPTSPVDGTTYTAGTTLGTGTVAYVGSSLSNVISGLTVNTNYDFYVYGYNAVTCINGPVYNTNSPLSGTQSTTGCPTLSSVITIGAGYDYTTLTDALVILNGCGITQPTTLELQSNYISTSEAFPLSLGAITGASATNTITIRPASNVASALTISSSNATGTINLNAGNYFIIDGRPGGTGTNKFITIENTSSSGYAVNYQNEASNNILRYSTIKGQNTSTTSGTIVFSTTTGANGNDNNTVEYNDICAVNATTATPTNAIYAIGTTTSNAANNNSITISNNNIFDFFSPTAGVDFRGLNINNGNDGWTINGNSFYQTVSRSYTTQLFQFINLGFVNHTQPYIINNNYFGGTQPLCGGASLSLTSTSARLTMVLLSSSMNVTSEFNGNTFANTTFNTATTSTLNNCLQINNGSWNIGATTGNIFGSSTQSGSITISTTGTNGAFSAIHTGNGTNMGVINIRNNTISGITVNGAGTMDWYGLNLRNTTNSGTYSIENNIIGESSLSNSILNTTNKGLYGIYSLVNTLSVTQIINNNSISNLNSTNVGSAAQIYGIWTPGSTGGKYQISNNIVHSLNSAGAGAAVYGIYNNAATSNDQIISGNTLHSLTNTGSSAAIVGGIYYSGPTSGTNEIRSNLVHSLSAVTAGSTLTGIQIADAGNALIYNNMIRLGINAAGSAVTTNATVHGINQSGSTSNHSFYFNSIYIGGAGVVTGTNNTFALHSAATSGTRNIRNNIFSNERGNGAGTGKHFAVRLVGLTGLTINNNDYWTGASFLAQNNTTDVTSFAAWQTATSQDAGSLSNDPNFINATGNATSLDLHINNTTSSVLESGGVNIPGITSDRDGDSRPGPAGSANGGGISSDIGADEFDGIPGYTCSTFPALTATTNNATVCGGTSATLSISGTISGTGVTYQWQSASTQAGTYTNIVGATGSTYVVPVSSVSNLWYICQVTCANGPVTSATSAVNVQVSACNYTTSRNTGISYNSIMTTGSTYTTLNGTTPADDGYTNVVSLAGTTFKYRGLAVTGFVATTNGWMTFNTASTSNEWVNNLTSSSYTNVLAPLWDDLVIRGANLTNKDVSMRYQVVGTLGSGTADIIIEWAEMERFNYGDPNVNFQVVLHESDNSIDFNYGNFQMFNGATNGTTWSYSIGMNGPTPATVSTDQRIILQAENSNFFNSTSQNSLGYSIECNSQFRFVPSTTFSSGSAPTSGSFTASSFVPSNNEVAGAVTLSVNGLPCTSNCGNIYSSKNATASTGISVCSATTPGTPDDDVFFKFTTSTLTNYRIAVDPSAGYNAVIQVLDASLNPITCVNAAGAGLSELITSVTLNASSLYYLRIYDAATGATNNGEFAICISEVIAPPANDEPAGAIALTTGLTCTPTSSILPATLSATATSGVTSCSAGTPGNADDDIWYSFTTNTIAGTTYSISATGVSTYNAVLQLYSGTVGSLVSVNCANSSGNGGTETINAGALATNTTYYLRVYHSGSGAANGNVSICVVHTLPTCLTSANTASNDYVWQGQTTDWNSSSNWLIYNGPSSYTVANAAPSNVNVIIPSSSCFSNQPVVLVAPSTVNNLTVLSGATLSLGGNTLSITGNLNVAGTFTPGSGTVNFIGTGTQVVTLGSQSLNNVTINGSNIPDITPTVQLNGNTTINGDFTNNSGSLNLNNFNLTIGGNYSNYVASTGTANGLIPNGGAINFNKVSGTQTLDQAPGLDFFTIRHTGAGTLQLLSDISTIGNIENSAGTFDGNGKVITIKGNFNNTATFNSGTGGEMIFEKDGGNQTLTAGTAVFDKLIHQIPNGGVSSTLTLSGIIDIKGDFVIDAPIIAGTSTVKLSGTTDQTISGSESIIPLTDMTIAKTSGKITLATPVRVDGALTMTQGDIITDASNILEIGSSATSVGSVSWAAGTVRGPMKRWFANAVNNDQATGIFPVGADIPGKGVINRYAQVNFTSATGGGYIIANYVVGTPSTGYAGLPITYNTNQYIQNYEEEGYWDITPYNASGTPYAALNTAPYTLKLRMNNPSTLLAGLPPSGSNGNAVADISKIRIISSKGPSHNTWVLAGSQGSGHSVLASGDYLLEETGVTGFSFFNGGGNDNNPLPVELSYFSGVCTNELVTLTWQTASEQNSSHFDIERSNDGENWRVIGTVSAAGNSTEEINYSFIDSEKSNGDNYYRLNQVDIDGKNEIYGPITISCGEEAKITTYPNPSKGEFNLVMYAKSSEKVTLKIIDGNSRVISTKVFEIQNGINLFPILENLSSGVYHIQLISESGKTTVLKHSVY